MRTWGLAAALAAMALSTASAEQAAPSVRYVIIDSSGSMAGPKISQARAAARQELLSAKPEQFTALQTFGRDRERQCESVDILLPLAAAQTNSARVDDALKGTSASGSTPIALALERAGADVGTETAEIVLITDGADSCSRNVCEVVDRWRLEGRHIQVRLHPIGMEPQSRDQLSCLSSALTLPSLAHRLAPRSAATLGADAKASVWRRLTPFHWMIAFGAAGLAMLLWLLAQRALSKTERLLIDAAPDDDLPAGAISLPRQRFALDLAQERVKIRIAGKHIERRVRLHRDSDTARLPRADEDVIPSSPVEVTIQLPLPKLAIPSYLRIGVGVLLFSTTIAFSLLNTSAIVAAWINLTDAQAQLLTVLIPLMLGALAVAILNIQIDAIRGTAEKARALGADLDDTVGAFDKTLTAVASKLSDIQGREQIPTPEASPPGGAKARISAAWQTVRDHIEEISTQAVVLGKRIDGRTLAAYARVDRRKYDELLQKMHAGGSLSTDQFNDFTKAFALFKSAKPRTDSSILPEEVTAAENLAKKYGSNV